MDFQGKRNNGLFFLLAIVLMLLPLYLSCGGGYSDPAGTANGQHISSLLSPQQLKAWIDNGYMDERGYKVVILDGSSSANYNAGHIPGSYSMSYTADLTKTRSDGPMMVPLMVADGTQMDAFVQKYGIDGNKSVVVFTGDSIIWAARGYWTFRYWGFPQSRLFVLNGKSTTAASVWTSAGYALTTTAPSLPTPSSFSVNSWPGNIDQVRAPLEEIMSVAEGKVTGSIIHDTRAEAEYNATVSATFSRAFEYRWNNSVWRPWELNVEGTNVSDPYSTIALASAGPQVLKSKDQLLAEWAAAGFTQDKKIYSTCAGGIRASLPFFIADGIFGWKNIKVDDGSSYEMGQLANWQNQSGTVSLPSNSQWRMDVPGKDMALITYQTDTTKIVAPWIVNPYAASGKEINTADKLYYSGGGGSGGGGGAPGY